MDVAAATWNLQPRQNLQRQRARERLGEACAGWRPACAWERPRKLFVRAGAPAAAAHELSAVDGMDGWIIPLMTDGGDEIRRRSHRPHAPRQRSWPGEKKSSRALAFCVTWFRVISSMIFFKKK